MTVGNRLQDCSRDLLSSPLSLSPKQQAALSLLAAGDPRGLPEAIDSQLPGACAHASLDINDAHHIVLFLDLLFAAVPPQLIPAATDSHLPRMLGLALTSLSSSTRTAAARLAETLMKVDQGCEISDVQVTDRLVAGGLLPSLAACLGKDMFPSSRTEVTGDTTLQLHGMSGASCEVRASLDFTVALLCEQVAQTLGASAASLRLFLDQTPLPATSTLRECGVSAKTPLTWVRCCSHNDDTVICAALDALDVLMSIWEYGGGSATEERSADAGAPFFVSSVRHAGIDARLAALREHDTDEIAYHAQALHTKLEPAGESALGGVFSWALLALWVAMLLDWLLGFRVIF